MQEMLSFTVAVAVVTLTSSSKTVCQHIVHVRQLTYCSVKLLNSWVQASDLSPAKYLIWGITGRITCIRYQFIDDLRRCVYILPVHHILTLAMASHKALWMMPLTEWPKRL